MSAEEQSSAQPASEPTEQQQQQEATETNQPTDAGQAQPAAAEEPKETSQDQDSPPPQQAQQAPADEKPTEQQKSSDQPAEEKPKEQQKKEKQEPTAEKSDDKPAQQQKKQPAQQSDNKPSQRSQRSASKDPSESNSGRQHHADPFVGLSAMERVKLGYKMVHDRFAHSKHSASFVSRTVRDPYAVVAAGSRTTPQMVKREEQAEARREALSKKLQYNPDTRVLPGTFSGTRNREQRRSSSWARDRSERRPFANSFETIASTRKAPTPGPGAYTSPLAFVGA